MKRNGYTIAEAMITMAIIGVVASLTIPTFVASQRKTIYANSISNAVSNFENGISMMMVKEGVDDLLNTEAWRAIQSGDNYKMIKSTSTSKIEKFMENVNKTLSLADYATTERKYSSLKEPNKAPSLLVGYPVRFKTKNGVEYMIDISEVSKLDEKSEVEALKDGSNYLNKAAEVYIDINGDNEPNVQGRDWFRYDLGTDGKLYPYYGQDYCIFHGKTYADLKTKCVTNKEGHYCAAYLMENGYKMDY